MDASHPPTAEAGAGFSGGPVPCPARKPRGSPLSHCLLGSQMPTPSRASFPLPCSPTAGSAPPPPPQWSPAEALAQFTFVSTWKAAHSPRSFHSPASHAHGRCGADALHPASFTRRGRGALPPQTSPLLSLPPVDKPFRGDTQSASCGGCQGCDLAVWRLSKSCKGSVYPSIWITRAFLTHSITRMTSAEVQSPWKVRLASC